MVNHCSVYKCTNSSKKNRRLSFFSIPSDTSRQMIWLPRIGKSEWILKPPETINKKRVCSEHFSTQMRSGTKLKKDAFPDVFKEGIGENAVNVNNSSIAATEKKKDGDVCSTVRKIETEVLETVSSTSPTKTKFHSVEEVSKSKKSSTSESHKRILDNKNTINPNSIAQISTTLSPKTPEKKKSPSIVKNIKKNKSPISENIIKDNDREPINTTTEKRIEKLVKLPGIQVTLVQGKTKSQTVLKNLKAKESSNLEQEIKDIDDDHMDPNICNTPVELSVLVQKKTQSTQKLSSLSPTIPTKWKSRYIIMKTKENSISERETKDTPNHHANPKIFTTPEKKLKAIQTSPKVPSASPRKRKLQLVVGNMKRKKPPTPEIDTKDISDEDFIRFCKKNFDTMMSDFMITQLRLQRRRV